MDELLRHCLRELSFDGDLGCNVSRLRDFVVDFYTHSTNTSAQNPDDAFCAFVWSLVVQQPTVIVGTVPEGTTSEVWIAPQNSAKRKAKAKGEETVEVAPPRLDIVRDAKNRSLEDLKEEYGDNLRLAADPEATYAAITGTHIRFPKMSPMVYSALQIITRGRDNGVSVVELGQKSKYDQKTCFYLVRQLTELDLVVKVRRGGVGSHFCIHRYFFDRSESWKAIREEETRAAAAEAGKAPKVTSTADQEEDAGPPELPGLHFSPIDARHLSSMPLVKARIIKLLKASKNLMHASNNMLIALGFAHPTKTDRRFFASRTRELVEQRVIENVFVPSKRRNDSKGTGVKCFRLVSTDPAATSAQDAVVIQPDEDHPADDQSSIKMNLTIHKQIITLVEESGTVGMTLNELTAALCQFDKRTVELLLTRAEKYPPPPHLSDLGIAGLMETSGRERRNRYYTIASYQAMVAREKLDKDSAGYADVDLSDVGGFFPFGPESFYTEYSALLSHQDRDARISRNAPKKKGHKNPVLLDGTVKKGRPRKERPDGSEPKPRKPRKRKAEDEGAGPSEPKKAPPAKKRRLNAKQEPADDVVESSADGPADPPPLPKKRGRPPKNPPTNDAEDAPPAPKKRGRAKKAETAAQPPKKRSRRIAANAEEGPGEPDPAETQDVASPPTKRPRPQSPAPAADTADDCIPPVAVLPAQSSPPPPSVKSTPLSSLLSSPLSSMPFDELKDGDGSLLTLPQLDDISMPAPANSVKIPVRRTLSDITAAPQRPSPNPEPGMTGHRKVNVSTLRRENELFRVLEILGGILNTQTKEMYDVHQELLVSMTQAGEKTSAPPGSRLDRRTATAAYTTMELRGRVKQLKTIISTVTGLTRPANIVYLPDFDEKKIPAFLTDQGRNAIQFPPYIPVGIVVDEHTEYGSNAPRAYKRPTTVPIQLLQAGRATGKARVPNADRADELFAYDEDTVREVLLTERTTLGQLYGFICGKVIRAREFHLHNLNVFENRVSSPGIVSHEKRVACFSFFYNEVPVGLYCALVAVMDGSEDLSRILSNPEGRKTIVKDLPSSLHTLLQVGRTRGRGRILELLEILRSLGLATPLEPCVSGSPLITCDANGDYPTSFGEVASDDWSMESTATAPNYWHFPSTAAVYHWAESESNPRFLRRLPLTSCSEAVEYWDFLRLACIDNGMTDLPEFSEPPGADLTLARKKAKTIRRRVSWNDNYSFTWHQTHYIGRYIHGFPGQPPLQLNEISDEMIQKLSRVVSAPERDVREYLKKSQAIKVVELEKANRRIQREMKNKAMDEEDKVSLAQKAAEARAQREAKWEGLVTKVHPGPLGDAAAIRLRRVRTLFLQATGSQTAKWEREIAQAVHEADMATAVNALNNKRFKWNAKTTRPPPPDPSAPAVPLSAPPVVDNQHEKSVASLIAAQGPLVIEKARQRKLKNTPAPAENSGQNPAPVENPGPRTRFHWNKDYDELAKDAFAIIHSRCRTRGKVDYGAIKQVFPGVNKANVRSRMKATREAPAIAAYVARLEDHWHALWLNYRATEFLPDEDPLSLKFDLVAHIEFLRKHIDKNALRVGFAHEEEKELNIIPGSIEELMEEFDVVEPPLGPPPWDFMWSGMVDEGREKRAMRQAFTTRPDELVLGTEISSDTVLLAESVLKMTMGTAVESYDAETASEMLHKIGHEAVGPAQGNLLRRGVLAWRFKNPSSHPGRMLKISEGNQNAIGGSIPHDTFQDAAALEDISVDDQSWREWPLLSTDGDTAALIQLVSDNTVDFKIDTIHAQGARAAIDWNSKKADDDHIETAILVRFHDISTPQTPTPRPTPALPAMEVETIAEHGVTDDGAPACCKRVSEDSLIDCAACLEEEWGSLYASLGHQDRDEFQLILDTVMESGATGIPKKDLLAKTKLSADAVQAGVRALTECSVPLIFWAGYGSLVLVASGNLSAWTVQISAEPVQRIFPRRWIDMTGAKVMDLWEAATRAVMGVLVFHPGVTQVSDGRYFSSSRLIEGYPGSAAMATALGVRPARGGRAGAVFARCGVYFHSWG
ncbi:hypothetical protein C8R47DRAFT_1108154 [Mycena vitilis]|nr:hypothetical protein C8R47DRAFT_1108154 [Mycena vitilis]